MKIKRFDDLDDKIHAWMTRYRKTEPSFEYDDEWLFQYSKKFLINIRMETSL